MQLLFSALIESDAEGIGGSGFVECIREHIHEVRIARPHALTMCSIHAVTNLFSES